MIFDENCRSCCDIYKSNPLMSGAATFCCACLQCAIVPITGRAHGHACVQVDPGATADEFIVKGRGMLHLGILVENMRREGYEFQVGPPKVILKQDGGKRLEPYDEATVDAPEEYVGACVDLLASRKGVMKDLVTVNVRSTQLNSNTDTLAAAVDVLPGLYTVNMPASVACEFIACYLPTVHHVLGLGVGRGGGGRAGAMHMTSSPLRLIPSWAPQGTRNPAKQHIGKNPVGQGNGTGEIQPILPLQALLCWHLDSSAIEREAIAMSLCYAVNKINGQ
jgi:hypothetical protein